jgi:outer membrane protein TolC
MHPQTPARRLGRLLLVASAAPAALLGASRAYAQQPAPRPTAAAPAAAPAAPANAARALSLEEALRVAGTRSEALRIAQAGVQRARGTLARARSQLFPQLTGSLSYQRAIQNQFQSISEQAASSDESAGPPPPPALCAPNIPASATPEERAAALAAAQTCPTGDGFGAIGQIFASPNTVVLGLAGSQTLFAGGRQIAGLRAARAGSRAAALGVTGAQAQLQLEVTQAYFDAVLSDRLVSIAESTLIQAERTFRQTSLSRSVGSTSEFEALRARVTRDNQRPVVIQTRALRGTAYDRLRQLLDVPLDTPLSLSTQLQDSTPLPAALAAAPAPRAPSLVVPASLRLDASAEELLNAALSEDRGAAAAVDSVVAAADTSAGARNAVRQAAANVDAQRQLLRVTRGQRLPALSLTGNYQRFAYPSTGIPTAINQYYPNFTVGVGLSLPILTGGRIRGEELEAQANLAEAEQRLRQSEEVAALDARVAVNELTRAQAALLASAGTAEQAGRAFQIAEVRFREGVSTQVELSDSRLLLAQAQANRATAARDLQVARVRLALLRDLPLGAGTSLLQQQNGAAGGMGTGGAQQNGQQQAPSQQQQQQQGGSGVVTQTSASQSGQFGGNP